MHFSVVLRRIVYVTKDVPKLSFVIFFSHETLFLKTNAPWHHELCIVATDIETFIVACNQFEETCLLKISALLCKELSHSLLRLNIVFEMTSRECGFQCRCNVCQCRTPLKVQYGKIGVVGCVIQSLSDESCVSLAVCGFALSSKSTTLSLKRHSLFVE